MKEYHDLDLELHGIAPCFPIVAGTGLTKLI